MNCSEFREVVQELAQQGRPDPVGVSREGAWAHARMCPRCDALLTEAASLTAALRALALNDARVEAPARVEAAVLAAYRRSCVPAPKPARARLRMPAAITGLAIAVGLAMAVFLYHPAKHTILSRAIAPAAIPSPASALAKQIPDSTAQRNVTQGGAAQGGAARGESAHPPPASSSRQPVSLASGKPPDSSQNASALEDISGTNGMFMPLPYADQGPIENATVVRAVFPSTALGAFGLPITDGAVEGRVVADFIVGENGTPEAIRIVR
jgi:hypothetical protein